MSGGHQKGRQQSRRDCRAAEPRLFGHCRRTVNLVLGRHCIRLEPLLSRAGKLCTMGPRSERERDQACSNVHWWATRLRRGRARYRLDVCYSPRTATCGLSAMILRKATSSADPRVISDGMLTTPSERPDWRLRRNCLLSFSEASDDLNSIAPPRRTELLDRSAAACANGGF